MRLPCVTFGKPETSDCAHQVIADEAFLSAFSFFNLLDKGAVNEIVTLAG